ncbi:MAG: thermonuclease family protein [Thiotrichales bacterium]|nr:thermonuclease family protein [Thiotrichales bacterium]
MQTFITQAVIKQALIPQAITLRTFLTFVLLSGFSAPLWAANPDNCQNSQPDLWVDASYALDGSTLLIQNQRVQLIGVYAPQKGKTYKFNSPSEPMAEAAQTYLNRLLANNDLKIGIVYDQSQTNANRVQQVHAFLQDGRNLNALMLSSGLALNRTQNANLLYAECYYAAEQQARQQGRGLWDLAATQPELHFPLIQSHEITAEDQGFRIVRGKIVEVLKSDTYYLLNMDTTGIRIPKRAWSAFDFAQLQTLLGQEVEVRAYAYLFKGHIYMLVEHPYAFDRFQPQSGS